MDGQLLVIDEWLIDDIRCANGVDYQVETSTFLQEFEQSRDMMAVLDDSPWMEKFHNLMRQTGPETDDYLARISSKLIRALIETPSKCIYLYQSDIDAADVSQDAIAVAPEEDIYLIELYYAAKANLLITPDGELHDAFDSRPDLNVNVKFRDDFLTNYLQQN